MTPSTHFLARALLVATVCALAGCASRDKSPSVARTAASDHADYPLIVRLVGRHYTVSASSAPHGVVYSAEGADGRQIVANATLDELRSTHPDVYQQLFPGIATKGDAESAGRRDTAEDAGIDGPVPMGHVSQPATGMGPRGEMLLHSADRW